MSAAGLASTSGALALAALVLTSCDAPLESSPPRDAALEASDVGDECLPIPCPAPGWDPATCSCRPPADASEPEADALPSPPDIPSAQTVTFVVSNASTEVRYVVIRGAMCTTFQIERASGSTWESLPLAVGYDDPDEPTCNEESVDFNGPGPENYLLLDPGESMTLTWDARAAVFGAATFHCKNHGSIEYHWAGFQPVGPGTYRLSQGYSTTVPDSCQPLSNDPRTLYCQTNSTSPPPVLSVCDAPAFATAQFDLPPSGNVEVQVDVP